MKKLTFVTLSFLMISSLSQAEQVAYKCSGQLPDPQGKMIDVIVAGIIEAHGYVKSVGALKVGTGDPALVYDSGGDFDYQENGVRLLVDQPHETALTLQVPDGSIKELGHEKSGNIFAYAAGISFISLNGIPSRGTDAKANKVDCIASVEKKSTDGFKYFWGSLGESLSTFMINSTWPAFNKFTANRFD